MNHKGGPAMHRSPDAGHLCGVIALCVLCIFFQGCASTPDKPRRPDNICEIFRENPKWYKDSRKASLKWGVPIPVLMAIMHQESKYTAKAKPPRTSCLWVLPGPRPSSAYGYSQAKDETWKAYMKSTGQWRADRDEFGDAIDFIGWYCNISNKRCGISKMNANYLYLAYHEGHGGFNRKTYKKKKWLLRVAHKVQRRANSYQSQLASCESEFSRGTPCCLWPF